VNGPIIVLDSGAIDQVATNQPFRTVVRELAKAGWHVVIPTVVLAEVITGRPIDAATNHAVNRLGTEHTDEATARVAGRLRAGVERTGRQRIPSGIDAIVAAHAVGSGEQSVVFTTDVSDLQRLLADHPRVAVERP